MLPETLLHYRILQPIGAGGMGDVYLAEDTKLGRRVALKVLPLDRSGDPERRQRFEREARAIASLNHPNIVTIHAVEQAGDVAFLAMELVEGKTLAEILPKTGLPIDRLLKIAIPIADAVAAAHDRGITHRDLKPQNVMIGADGRVKVLDFGLAKLEEDAGTKDASLTTLKQESLTGEGRIVGTVAYMSPEQAEGKPLDRRTDIFSLGVVLYEMATGERPFKGDTTVSTLSSILRDVPPAVSDVNAAMPRDFARIVKRTLAKDPEHRYQTAKDVRNDLEELRDDLTSSASSAAVAASASASASAVALPAAQATSTSGTSATAVMPVRSSNVLRYAVMAAGAIAVVAGLVWFFTRDKSPASSGSSATSAPFEHIKLTRLTNTGRVGLTAVSPDARYVVHVSFDDGNKQSLWLRQIVTNSNVQIVQPDAVRYDGVSFSPDGNFVYYVVYPAGQNFSVVYQVPVLGGTPRRVMDDVDTPPAFSPDGKQFAFLRGFQRLGESALFVANADGTNERRVVVRKNPLGFMLNNVSWSPDGKTILAICRVNAEGQVRIDAIDATSGTETLVGEGAWAAIDTVAWLPDGRGYVAAAAEDTPDGELQLWHFNYPGGVRRRITSDLNTYLHVTVSADASTMVAVQNEGVAHMYVGSASNAAAASQITSGTNRADGTSGIAWTPDGRLVYGSNASGNFDIWISDAAGSAPRQLTTYNGFDGTPLVTPDGKSIVFNTSRKEGAVWIMDLDGGNQRPLITNRGAGRPALSPDMKWLYYTTFSTQLREVWRQPFPAGTPERLTAEWKELGIKQDGVFYHPTVATTGISPDGTMLLGYYADPDRRGFRMGIFPIAGGTPTRLDILDDKAVFMADGQSLLYRDWRSGPPNLYRLPLKGGAPVQVTSFTKDAVIAFALSRDGKQVAMSRGLGTSDVVLIRPEKKD